MSQVRSLLALMVCVVSVFAVQAQKPQGGSAVLPVSRIALFSSGVAYFQREGEVDGNARIDLQFHASDINDLLKSLILQDRDGGHIGTISYDNRDPIEKTLKSFAIDLTDNPSLGQLLEQARGERVEIHTRPARRAPLKGVIVGVERRRTLSVKESDADLQAALSKTVSLSKGIEVNTPLKDAVEWLQSLFQVTIVIDSHAFKSDLSVDAVEEQPVKLPIMMRVSLATILRLLSEQVNGAYRIGPDAIEITTMQRAATPAKSEIARPAVGGQASAGVETLNLLTDGGLENIALDRVEVLRFLKPELDREFRQALELIGRAKDKQKKTVSVNFQGNGKRRVKVGYVTENPIWKTSYRLAIEEGANQKKAFLQGWAMVENTTDEDWNNVSLALVSGRPISFAMDLYEPLYLSRPIFEPELFASLRPETYEGNIDELERDRRRRTDRGVFGGMAGAGMSGGLGFGGGFGGMGSGVGLGGLGAGLGFGGGGGGMRGTGPVNPAGQQQGLDDEGDRRRGRPFDLRKGIVSAAFGTELGKNFRYQIEQPVSLARQKSALLPIVNHPVEAASVSIYNQSVHLSFPLHGLRLKNTTGLHLMQGPITVFEGNSYAGDATIADLEPNETRLISYAVDLGIEVVPESRKPLLNLVAATIKQGVLQQRHKIQQVKQYTIKNRSDHSRLVIVEHAYTAGWSLVEPSGPVKVTRAGYRFEVKSEPGKTAKLKVVEESTKLEESPLGPTGNEAITLLLSSGILSAKVRAGLEDVLALRRKIAETSDAIRAEEQPLDLIEKDQTRMRANMERVPRDSEAYKRYLKKFDDQETEIERRQAQFVKLRAALVEQQRAYEVFLMNLSAE